MGFFKQKLDNQNRLLLSKSLFDLTNLTIGKTIAICKGTNYIFLRNIDDIDNCDVLAISKIDSKYRITIPKAIRNVYSSFEVVVNNSEIRIRGMS
jgi:hypothetical protein